MLTSTPYFSSFYGLNLFLSLLLIEALRRSDQAEDRNAVKVYTGQQIVSIRPKVPDSVEPPLTAEQCLGVPWLVQLRGVTRPLEANVIIMRHGLAPHEAEASARPRIPGVPRPMPPTHIH